jgi:hypothetical protein
MYRKILIVLAASAVLAAGVGACSNAPSQHGRGQHRWRIPARHRRHLLPRPRLPSRSTPRIVPRPCAC